MSAVSQEEIKNIENALGEGKSLLDALGINSQALEMLYSMAYSNYKAGNYKDAETLFATLTGLDVTDKRFSMGLGATRQGQDKFHLAIDAYALAIAATNGQDPQPKYYAALCMFKMGKKEAAIDTLEKALAFHKEENCPEIYSTMQSLLATLK